MSSIRFSIDLMFFFLCVFERPKSWPDDQFILAEKFIHIDVDCGFRISVICMGFVLQIVMGFNNNFRDG